MPNALVQIRAFLAGLTPKQKLSLFLSAAGVLAGIFGLVWFASKPDLKTAVTGLKTANSQAIAARLAAKKIPYQLSADATSIAVPAEQLDAARLEIAGGSLPKDARIGFEIFDQPNWAASEFSERVNYQRAIEGELERTIAGMEDVEGARVHIVLPNNSLFSDREKPAKASVVLRMSSSPDKQTLGSIARLVASAVDGLQFNAVTIVDAESGRTFAENSGEDGLHASPLDQELTTRLLLTLEPIVGPGLVRTSVRVENELSSVEETQETYDPNVAVTLTTQKSEERNGITSPGGVPGTSSNLPNAPGGQLVSTFDATAQLSKSENSTFGTNKTVRHTIYPPGRLRRVSAAVLVDDARDPANQGQAEKARKRTSEELKQIEELARATLGLDAARGDVVTVQNITFSRQVDLPALPITKSTKVRLVLQGWSTAIRYGAIFLLFGLIYMLMFRPLKRQVRIGLQARLAVDKNAALTEAKKAETDNLLSPSRPELKRAAALKRDVAEKIKTQPLEASRLLQNWIGEDIAE